MPEADVYLIQLIASFQSAAMLQMGKIMNPITGKIERDLDQAKYTIELLAMLQRKTAGNLTDDEKRYLDHALFELRMNYVDESERPTDDRTATGDQGADAAAPTDAAAAPDQADDGEGHS